MKKNNMFLKFDFPAWQTGKTFAVTSAKYNENRGCITLDGVITRDETDYGDSSVSNLYEKFKIHCVNDTKESDVSKYPIGAEIKFVKLGKVSVYGDYNTNLSVEAVVEVVK